jgi:hypothetical protein
MSEAGGEREFPVIVGRAEPSAALAAEDLGPRQARI